MKRFLAPVILILATIIQMSFLNPSYAGVNLILVLAIAFTLTRGSDWIIPAIWLAGIISDIGKSTLFGAGALALLCAMLLVAFGSRFFLSRRKTRNILIMSAAAAVLYRLSFVVILNAFSFISSYDIREPIGIYFLTWGFLGELILTPFLVLGIFKLFFNEKTYNF